MTHAIGSSNGRPHRNGTLVLAPPGTPAVAPLDAVVPELVGRVLASVAGRLADSVDGIPARSTRAGAAVEPVRRIPVPRAAGPAVRVVLDQLARLLEWVRLVITRMIGLASRLVGRGTDAAGEPA